MSNKLYDRDLGYNKLMLTFSLNDRESSVNVGFLRSSGMHRGADNMTVASLAAIHEYGSSDGRIPERSFMRSAVDDNANAIQALIKKLIGKIADGETTEKKALGYIGQFLRDCIINKINKGVPPPNAPSTIARKGSSKPLVDTGQLKNSVDFEVLVNKGKAT